MSEGIFDLSQSGSLKEGKFAHGIVKISTYYIFPINQNITKKRWRIAFLQIRRYTKKVHLPKEILFS